MPGARTSPAMAPDSVHKGKAFSLLLPNSPHSGFQELHPCNGPTAAERQSPVPSAPRSPVKVRVCRAPSPFGHTAEPQHCRRDGGIGHSPDKPPAPRWG